MIIRERRITLRPDFTRPDLFDRLRQGVEQALTPGDAPIRFAVVGSSAAVSECEVGVIRGAAERAARLPELFAFRQRHYEATSAFTVALIVPTGVGCSIGGHAGDGGPVAQLIGSICDRLVLHPNVVNGSDINEMPANSLYVEGSTLSRLMQGTVSLQPVRANRVLVISDAPVGHHAHNGVINAVNAARATYGLDCPGVIGLHRPVSVQARYTRSGRATGLITGMDRLVSLLEREKGSFDAVAVAGHVKLSAGQYEAYIWSKGEVVNPIGGAEALYTHAVSYLTDLPSAHAPVFGALPDLIDPCGSPDQITGIVDPRMAAEVISTSFMQSVLKGLHRSPRIHADDGSPKPPDWVSAEHVSALVVPDGVLGLPVLAALCQGIHVIAVTENTNRMRNDLAQLPWRPGQFTRASTYLEAAGILSALRAGIALASLRRPLEGTPCETREHSEPRRNRA